MKITETKFRTIIKESINEALNGSNTLKTYKLTLKENGKLYKVKAKSVNEAKIKLKNYLNEEVGKDKVHGYFIDQQSLEKKDKSELQSLYRIITNDIEGYRNSPGYKARGYADFRFPIHSKGDITPDPRVNIAIESYRPNQYNIQVDTGYEIKNFDDLSAALHCVFDVLRIRLMKAKREHAIEEDEAKCKEMDTKEQPQKSESIENERNESKKTYKLEVKSTGKAYKVKASSLNEAKKKLKNYLR
jgi:hypothetical protein